jgi:cytochrome c oxidase assembly factor 2
MSIYKALRLTQRRSFVSSLFGFTFVATVLTVSASEILPCPARPIKGTRFADSQDQRSLGQQEALEVKVQKRPTRRWIEEKIPPPQQRCNSSNTTPTLEA